MRKRKNVLEDLLEMSGDIFPDKQELIAKKARLLFRNYYRAEKGKPKEVTMHTVKRIFPCIAFYKAVAEYTDEPERAYSIIDEYFAKKSFAAAKVLQGLFRIPFAFRSAPRGMAVIIHKIFGSRSGFEMSDRVVTGEVCHIDMLKCPYHMLCREQGCPELTTVFCNSDDAAYGAMHPKLSWERSSTLGRGDDRCDFILRVKR